MSATSGRTVLRGVVPVSKAAEFYATAQREFAQGKLRQADRMFQAAIAQDARYAAQVGNFYDAQSSAAAKPYPLRVKARQFYTQAVQVTPQAALYERLGTQCQALSHLSTNGYNDAFNQAAAESFRQALALNPRAITSHHGYLYSALDRYHAHAKPTLVSKGVRDEAALMTVWSESAMALRLVPQIDDLQRLGALAAYPQTAKTQAVIESQVLPVLRSRLLTTADDAVRLAILTVYGKLLHNHPWSASAVLDAMHAALGAQRFTAAQTGAVVGIYSALAGHLPNRGAAVIADLALLRPALQNDVQCQNLIDTLRTVVRLKVEDAATVTAAINLLVVIAVQRPTELVTLAVAATLIDIGSHHPPRAPGAFTAVAHLAKRQAPSRVTQVIRTDLIQMGKRNDPRVSQAAHLAVRLLGGPRVPPRAPALSVQQQPTSAG